MVPIKHNTNKISVISAMSDVVYEQLPCAVCLCGDFFYIAWLDEQLNVPNYIIENAVDIQERKTSRLKSPCVWCFFEALWWLVYVLVLVQRAT